MALGPCYKEIRSDAGQFRFKLQSEVRISAKSHNLCSLFGGAFRMDVANALASEAAHLGLCSQSPAKLAHVESIFAAGGQLNLRNLEFDLSECGRNSIYLPLRLSKEAEVSLSVTSKATILHASRAAELP